ncbi:hypothetical protein FI667_g11365, partial [Globisporangium splendens]
MNASSAPNDLEAGWYVAARGGAVRCARARRVCWRERRRCHCACVPSSQQQLGRRAPSARVVDQVQGADVGPPREQNSECGQSRDGSGAPKCDTRVTIVYTKSYMDFVVLYDGVEHPVCAAAESDAHRVQHLHVADLDGGARRAGGARAGARVEPPATHGANGDSTSHPNSIYRHANLTTRHGEQDEE